MAKGKKNTNFWSGEPADAKTGSSAKSADNSNSDGSSAPGSKARSNSSAEVKRVPERRFDLKWLALAVIVIAAVAVAVILNLHHDQAYEDRLTNSLDIDNGGSKVNWDNYPTYDIELSSSLTITEPGTYHLTGTLDDGYILINADNNVVRLILDNATIKNSSGPAIANLATDEFVIELVGESTLEDGATYSSNFDEDVRGAIYSKDDLTFAGSGTLNLAAHLEDGIVGKDDIKIESGTYNITATDDGIRGTDSVYIVAGNFTINAGGDAIKSTNETDSTKGFVLIEDGVFNLTATAKGIKAFNTILIYGGTYNIKSTDDGIHADNYINIVGGDITIAAGDDGIHANNYLIIDGGAINITKSYEGLEAGEITINDGEISVVASDDGINANGGLGETESSTIRATGKMMDADESAILTVNGSSLYINASGDGIDSNGYIYFKGGNVVVDGPTSSGDGALDSGASIVMSGGTVVAVGSSGMAENLGASSSVYSASIYFSSTLAAGTKVEIKDSAGATIISHTSAKTFSHMAVGTQQFTQGETYTVYVNGSSYTTFTISDIVTTVGNSNMNFQNGAGGAGGQRR